MTGLRWVRLDGSFPTNHKIVTLAGRGHHRAITLYICALAWSGSQGTDGHIPRVALTILHGTRTQAQQLIDVGLWHTNDDGWTVHDWHDYQPRTATDISDSARKAANIRWHGTPNP